MPITEDIRDHQVFGREYKRGELTILRKLLEKRFGALPAWAEESLASRTWSELEGLSTRVLDARSLEELLK